MRTSSAELLHPGPSKAVQERMPFVTTSSQSGALQTSTRETPDMPILLPPIQLKKARRAFNDSAYGQRATKTINEWRAKTTDMPSSSPPITSSSPISDRSPTSSITFEPEKEVYRGTKTLGQDSLPRLLPHNESPYDNYLSHRTWNNRLSSDHMRPSLDPPAVSSLTMDPPRSTTEPPQKQCFLNDGKNPSGLENREDSRALINTLGAALLKLGCKPSKSPEDCGSGCIQREYERPPECVVECSIHFPSNPTPNSPPRQNQQYEAHTNVTPKEIELEVRSVGKALIKDNKAILPKSRLLPDQSPYTRSPKISSSRSSPASPNSAPICEVIQIRGAKSSNSEGKKRSQKPQSSPTTAGRLSPKKRRLERPSPTSSKSETLGSLPNQLGSRLCQSHNLGGSISPGCSSITLPLTREPDPNISSTTQRLTEQSRLDSCSTMIAMDFFPNGTHRPSSIVPQEYQSTKCEGVIDLTGTQDEEVIEISSDENDTEHHSVNQSRSRTEIVEQIWVKTQAVNYQESTRPLLHCTMYWSLGYELGEHDECNPLWDLDHAPLMGVQVMDPVLAYLVYHSVLVPRPHSSKRHSCIIPPSVFDNSVRVEHVERGLEVWREEQGQQANQRLQDLRGLVWAGEKPPGRLILPVIEPDLVHCYLWYGDTTPSSDGSKLDIHLKCLDSLSPPTDQEIERRLSLVRSVLAFVLPEINGSITGSLYSIPKYRQAIGSVDCGYFVCQAVSALAWGEDHSLWNLLPVDQVRDGIRRILTSHIHEHALHRLTDGYVHSPPILLHRESLQAPPPWQVSQNSSSTQTPRVKQRPSWNPPRYERSLSEPGDDRTVPQASDRWQHILGPNACERFKSVDPEAFGGYLQQLQNNSVSFPEGILEGAGGQIPETFLAGALLSESPISNEVPWLPPGVHIVNWGDGEEEELESPEKGLGINRFTKGLECLREGMERSKAVLTGAHQNVQMHLNWEAQVTEPELDCLSVSMDVDSLSLSVANPEFKQAVIMYPYPPRASTLTTDNGLKCRAFGEVRPLSHVPNFTLLTVGLNNQFRVNIHFPNYYKGKNAAGQYITYMTSEDYQRWYNSVMQRALLELLNRVPVEYRDAALRLRAALPRNYKMAEELCLFPGGRTFAGFKIMPELVNLLLSSCRRIVESSPHLAMFRGFFYHILGMNLKAVGQAVTRSDGNSLLHILRQFPFLDWSMQNPCDIAVDVGLEISVDPDKLSLDMDNITLIWRLSALKSLVEVGWRMPQIDAYMHSHVVGGVTCKPRTSISRMFYHFHAYMKDKGITYVHRDRSIGSSFSPADALLGSKMYRREIRALREVLLGSVGSYGVRAEFRCGVWAANELMKLDPLLWGRRFLNAGAILSFHTSKVVRYKVVVLDCYDWICQLLQRLPKREREEEQVMVLAAAVTYLIHGIVSRPDDMSSSRQMASLLMLVERSRRYGFPSIPSNYLLPGLTGIAAEVVYTHFKIINYMNRKGPAGARVKGSFAPVDDEPVENTHAELEKDHNSPYWHEDDGHWARNMIDKVLAGWLWARFPSDDKRQPAGRNAFQGPLLLHKWHQCVSQHIPHRASKPSHRFDAMIETILPKNWVLLKDAPCWSSFDPAFLEPIRARIDGVPSNLRAKFSSRVREELKLTLKTWEYIPFLQAKKLWVTEGSGYHKGYKLHINPAVARR